MFPCPTPCQSFSPLPRCCAHVPLPVSPISLPTPRAVSMCCAGCHAVCVLGVDFMSENVRAILDDAGFGHVPVYRLSADAIGCTLAEAAEDDRVRDGRRHSQRSRLSSGMACWDTRRLWKRLMPAHDLRMTQQQQQSKIPI